MNLFKINKKAITLLLSIVLLLTNMGVGFADSIDNDDRLKTILNVKEGEGNDLLILGKNLNDKQINELKKEYGIEGKDVERLVISNEEEHAALGKYVSKDKLGTKAMSSAYIQLLEDNEGVEVKTKNITWVTEDMYRNALTTAGVKDAIVFVNAPFPVSGTAALTGSMKAYEHLTGNTLSEENKDVANNELVTTAELSDAIGKEEAEKVIAEVKMTVLDNDIKDPEKIKEVVIEVAKVNNIELTTEQIDKIINLMERIVSLDLDVSQIKNQLGDIISKLDDIKIDTTEIKGFLGRIWEAITNFFKNIFNKGPNDRFIKNNHIDDGIQPEVNQEENTVKEDDGTNIYEDEAEFSYKPLIKYDDKIFGLTDNNYEPNKSLKEVGQIKESYDDSRKTITRDNQNFSSNTVKKGTVLYIEEIKDDLENVDEEVKNFILIKEDTNYLKFEEINS